MARFGREAYCESQPVGYTPPSFHCSGRFPTTAWSLVAEAKNQKGAGHRLAVNELTAKYWKPVFYFIRAKGYSIDRAEDLTQDFFFQFLQRDWIRRVDPQRGRFRTFMLTILTRFLADQGRARIRRQKQFEQEIVPISKLLTDEERKYEPPTNESPETIFMKRWSLTLVDRVRDNVRGECLAEGREAWYELFAANAMPDVEAKSSQSALARKFGLSRDQVRYRLEQVRRRFDRSFRIELRCDGCSENEVAAEVRELMDLL